MRIHHVSDTHGHFKDLKGYADIIVHSGDFCPDLTAIYSDRAKLQEEWLKLTRGTIKKWLNGKSLFFVLGNHDFISPKIFEQILRDAGIDAHDLTEKVVSYANTNFYGFPYVPPINGKFAYELGIPQMEDRVQAMQDVAKVSYIDVVVAHCPPHGCLDYCFHQYQRFGNSVLSNALDYKWDEDLLPQALLVGHIHTSNGITMRNGVLVSNAATSQNIVEI